MWVNTKTPGRLCNPGYLEGQRLRTHVQKGLEQSLVDDAENKTTPKSFPASLT